MEEIGGEGVVWMAEIGGGGSSMDGGDRRGREYYGW